MLALFAGYVLNGDHFDAGSPELAIYTQEALEEIEYVSGPADSTWGKNGAADGFPSRSRSATSRSATRTGLTARAATTAGSRRWPGRFASTTRT